MSAMALPPIASMAVRVSNVKEHPPGVIEGKET
jgi:hypothetical protein